jgi:hypothetical protein
VKKKFLLPIVASLLAYGLAVDTTVNVNTTGVSSDGVFFEVSAPASMNFVFDFTNPGMWATFQSIVANNTPQYIGPSNKDYYTVVVTSNVPYQIVVGVPTASGTGFPLDRYKVTIAPPSGGWQAKTLSDITAPWTVLTGNPGQTSYNISVSVYVTPNDVPSGYNQNIVIPLSVIPTP